VTSSGLETTKGLPLDVLGSGDAVEIASRGINLRDGSIPTPFAVLRRSALHGNLARMARYCDEHGISIAPHGKTTMSPELIAAQLEHGAWGITAATIAQVRAFREMGVPRVLLANMLVDPAGLRWAAEQLADPAFELIAYVDSHAAVAAMRRALEPLHPARPLPVLLEVGAEGGRTGTRSLASSVDIAELVRESSALELVGVSAFEGIIGGDREHGTMDAVDGFLQRVRETGEELARRGLIAGPELIVSAGGSAYFDRVAAILTPAWPTPLPVRVVIRSGCYVTHDVGAYDAVSPLGSHGDGGLAAALEVWGRVLSTPEPGLALADVGKRDASFDGALPLPLRVSRDGARTVSVDGMRVDRLNDQHAYIELEPGRELQVGDLVAFGISHPCTTFDRWRVLLVVDDDDRVVDLAHTWF
jgi:D-serine dehydratase